MTIWRALGLFCVVLAACSAQSTQGLITGVIRDSESGRPVAGIAGWHHVETGMNGSAVAGFDGRYSLPALSPGTYTLTTSAAEYQPQEVRELTLPVAGTLEMNFQLRPLHDVWERGAYRSVFLPGSGQVLNFFGPDLDGTRSATLQNRRPIAGTLEATLSAVIDPTMVEELPFAGRDIYAGLVLMPASNSDSGTGRSLGLVVNGQRPSSANYYLDGVEANNRLTGSPTISLPPEAVQEYRFSANNYSAQYGGTTGFIANAVTRAGGESFHGSVFGYLQNALLNANDFQRNTAGLDRPSGKIAEFGFQVGGPILARRHLFFSSLYDYTGSRTEQSPITYRLPTGTFIASLQPGSVAYKLLSDHPSIANEVTGGMTADLSLAAPVIIHRKTALERVDYATTDGRHRLTGRVALARISQPDFVWSPYAGLGSELRESPDSIALSHSFNVTQHLVNEARAGFGINDLRWNRGDRQVPNLLAADAYLPGSPALYDYKNATKSLQFIDNLIWTTGKHVITTGASYLERRLNGYFASGESGQFTFSRLRDFGSDAPVLYSASRSYVAGHDTIPAFYRNYRTRDYALFLQDTFRVSRRLVLNYGLRLERFGSPVNSGGTKDPGINLGPGSTLADGLKTATLGAAGSETIYATGLSWEPRVGVSFDLTGRGNTVVRAGFGILHDRILDNLWQTTSQNNLARAQWFAFPPASTNYLAPIETVLQGFVFASSTAPRFTLFADQFPTSRSYNYFTGIQHRFTQQVSLEVNALGARGRDLLTTDLVNRSPTIQSPVIINPALPFNIRYRSAQGFSDYHALTANVRYRARFVQLRFNYTWSHSIDNQSQPLEGDQFNLTGALNLAPIGFNRQFDSEGDRGNSDFDQRHNVVFYSIWESPARQGGWAGRTLSNWRFSQIAAFRSGFPYSIYGSGGRVDILDPASATITAQAVAGGLRLLNRAAFGNAKLGSGQTSVRNAFRGPGVYNVDVALSRTFAMPFAGESTRFVVRADAFNLLNHANLSNPGNFFLNPATFGISQYGRKGFDTGFPAVAPLNETARRVQLAIRIEF